MFAYYDNVYRRGERSISGDELCVAFRNAHPAMPRNGEDLQAAKRNTYAAVCFGLSADGTPTGHLAADYDHCEPEIARRIFEHTCMLPWVYMCGRSHSGGVWAVWRVGAGVASDEVFRAMHTIGAMSEICIGGPKGWQLDPRSIVESQLRYVAPCSIEKGTLYYNPNATAFERPTSDRHAAHLRISKLCGKNRVVADVALLMLPAAACPGGITVMRGDTGYRYIPQCQVLGASGLGKSSLLRSLRKAFEACGTRIARPASHRMLEQVFVDSVFDVTATTKSGKATAWAPKPHPLPTLILEDENAEHLGSTMEHMSRYRSIIRSLSDGDASVQTTLETRMPQGFYRHAISYLCATTGTAWASECKNCDMRAGELRRQHFADLGDITAPLPIGCSYDVDFTPLLESVPARATPGSSDAVYVIKTTTATLLMHEALVYAFGDPASTSTRAFQAAAACAFWGHEDDMSYESLLCGHAIEARSRECIEALERKIITSKGVLMPGADGARFRIQERLCADGGGVKKASSFRSWLSRDPTRTLHEAFQELKLEGRIRITAKEVQWVYLAPDCCASTAPPELNPEQAASRLAKLNADPEIRRQMGEVKNAQDGRRTFLLKLRGTMYRAGLWTRPEAMQWFRSVAEFVGCAQEKVDALVLARVTLDEHGSVSFED